METPNYSEGIKYDSAYLNADDEKVVNEVSKEISQWYNDLANPIENESGMGRVKHTTVSGFLDFWKHIYPDLSDGIETEKDDFKMLGTMATLSGFRIGLHIMQRGIAGIMQFNGGKHTAMTYRAQGCLNRFGDLLKKELIQIIEGKQEFVPESEEATQE